MSEFFVSLTILFISHFLGVNTTQIEQILGATDTFFAEETTQPTRNTEQELAYTASSTATVSRVIDGDTVELSSGEKVRYIGIDSPETKKPNSPIECYGAEATQKNIELVEGKTVTLEQDVNNTDRYGRLLRYVYVDDLMINEQLVKEGYAAASNYPPDVAYQEKLSQAEEYARTNKLGLWSEVCQ